MYFEFGRPRDFSSMRFSLSDLSQIKRGTQIAVIDDQPFKRADALRRHGFNILEVGDIRSIDQVAAYPIVVCDIRGVGVHFDSSLEGAHLISEIRKSYPDKFLVTYSGAQFDVSYNQSLKSVDLSIEKDASTEKWVAILDEGVSVANCPRRRWLRFRSMLLSRGIELHDVFRLEQGYIKAIESRDHSKMKIEGVAENSKELVSNFVNFSLKYLIGALVA